MAVGFGAGVAIHLAGAPTSTGPILLALLVLPIRTWLGPGRPAAGGVRIALAVTCLAGWLSAAAHDRHVSRRCVPRHEVGSSLVVVGTIAAEPRFGRLILRSVDGPLGDCGLPLTVRLAEAGGMEAGTRLRVRGRWRPTDGVRRGAGRPGELLAESVQVIESRRGVLHARGAVKRRVRAVFGNHAPVVAALVLADKGELEPEIRESFARSGTAHLLAISGFHVGVVAGLVMMVLAASGLGRRAASGLAALVVWMYVGFIGAPDAAVRAALLLSFLAVGRVRGRPVHPMGALSTAFLGLLVLDPAALGRPGFQLSFAGAAGLALSSRRLRGELERLLPGERFSGLKDGLAAGLVATVATLPIVAWHFGRVSVVGVFATLAGTPLLVVIIPGIFFSVLAHAMHPGVGSFLAGGVEVLIQVLVGSMSWIGGLPFAAVTVSRPEMCAAAIGALLTLVAVAGLPPIGRGVRRTSIVVGVAAGMVVLPVARSLVGTGVLEIRALDVGQGDAILLRSPRGRWMLVDAGPLPYGGGGSRLAGQLRAAGANELTLLVLTHPDLDHIGGGAEVVRALDVGTVGDPGWPRGTSPYVGVLRESALEGVPWVSLRRGDRFDFDGATLDVLHPPRTGGPGEPNEQSVVLYLRYGLFSALLTGDAPLEVEEAIVGELGPVDLLKVAHHGSRTSSSDSVLRLLRPAVSVVSAGRNNRYGHPHPEVLTRLNAWSGSVLRTDRDGSIRIRARADGTWSALASSRRAAG